MPYCTTACNTGNCSTIWQTSASVRSLCGSSVLKVRIHVWHSESQRFVVSRYRVRGKVGTKAGRFDVSIADLQVIDIRAHLAETTVVQALPTLGRSSCGTCSQSSTM